MNNLSSLAPELIGKIISYNTDKETMNLGATSKKMNEIIKTEFLNNVRDNQRHVQQKLGDRKVISSLKEFAEIKENVQKAMNLSESEINCVKHGNYELSISDMFNLQIKENKLEESKVMARTAEAQMEQTIALFKTFLSNTK